MPLLHAQRLVRIGIALALLGFGAAALIARLRAGDAGARNDTLDIAMFVGLVIGGVGLLLTWVGWRTLRLASARNTIARWTVTPQEWSLYVAACRMRESMSGALPGAIPLDTTVPSAGVEVLALRKGFLVGDCFQEIGTLGAELIDMRVVDSPAHLFEFNVIYATGKSSSVRLGVRVPIAAGADALANTVEDYWVKREPLQTMSNADLSARERRAWIATFIGLASFLGIVAWFAVLNPPGYAALAPIGALTVTFGGLYRVIRLRNVRLSRK